MGISQKRFSCKRQIIPIPLIGGFVILFFLTGCMSYRYDCRDYCICPDEEEAAEHWLYNVIPRHRSQIYWYDIGHWCTWALLGNDDDGIFGEGPNAQFHCEEPPSFKRALAWGARNSLHNFCFYVIGQAYWTNSAFTLLQISQQHCEFLCYHPEATTNFPDADSCLYLALHGWKPFVSLRLRTSETQINDFYLGWRERGNFGIKCQLLKKEDSVINNNQKNSDQTHEK